MRPDAASFSHYTSIVFFGGCDHDLLWTVVESEMAVETFFTFPATACDGLPILVRFGDDSELMTQSGGVSVPILLEVREAIKKIRVIAERL